MAVLLFFTAAATKLPSYWLPAIPAAAVLIALAARLERGDRAGGVATHVVDVLAHLPILP